MQHLRLVRGLKLCQQTSTFSSSVRQRSAPCISQERAVRQQRRGYNEGGQGDNNTTSPLEFVKAFRKDTELFPEYFNPVTYALFALLMGYLLYLTSNSRGRNWFFRHFSLSSDNMKEGRIYTLITHPLLETSAISLAINLMLLRWGGNMVLNIGGGEKGFVRALGILAVVPGALYLMFAALSRRSAGDAYMNIGGAVVPQQHFTTGDSITGLHGVTAGLLANATMEIKNRFPASKVFGMHPNTVMPALFMFYFLLASSGSEDSWLSLYGVITAIAHRRIFGRGF